MNNISLHIEASTAQRSYTYLTTEKSKSELIPITIKIVNPYMETGEMPSDSKYAAITLLLKRKGIDLVYKTFRPVPGLPFLSKDIEKVVSQKLSQYITASNFNQQYQPAYRCQHSKETTLLN